jgi:hypothetical protein
MIGRAKDILAVSLPPAVRMYGVLGLVVIAMSVSSAGMVSGLGLFILSMISMSTTDILMSSLLLSFSSAVFLLCYGWLTA